MTSNNNNNSTNVGTVYDKPKFFWYSRKVHATNVLAVVVDKTLFHLNNS